MKDLLRNFVCLYSLALLMSDDKIIFDRLVQSALISKVE